MEVVNGDIVGILIVRRIGSINKMLIVCGSWITVNKSALPAQNIGILQFAAKFFIHSIIVRITKGAMNSVPFIRNIGRFFICRLVQFLLTFQIMRNNTYYHEAFGCNNNL